MRWPLRRFDNVMFVVGVVGADSVGIKFFDRCFSVDSFLLLSGFIRTLAGRLFRVMATAWTLFHIIQTSTRDNAVSLQWGRSCQVPCNVRSAAE